MTGNAHARRLTAKGKATRDRIVATAAQLMFEHGVAGTSTEDVLHAAGLTSPSQLYHYFRDKRSLTQAVIQHQTELVLGFQRPLLSRLDSIDALYAWRDAIIETQRARQFHGGCPLGSLSAELSDHDPEARTELAAGYQLWQHAIRDGLRAMHQRGQLDADADPDRLALALLTALQGGLLMTQLHHDTQALRVVLDTVIDSVIGQVRRHAVD